MERLLDEGAWENSETEPFYEPYKTILTPEELAGSVTDSNGVITKDGIGIGITIDGKSMRGFKTPSRKMEVRSVFISKIGLNEDCSDLINQSGVTKTKSRPKQHEGHDLDISVMPIWLPFDEHQTLGNDELIMTSFKWNVHNHGRTMNLKWLAEIVHSNPAWLNPQTAKALGLKDGDWVELTSYYSQMLEKMSPNLNHQEPNESGKRVVSQMRVPIVMMQGIHPKASR